MIHAKSPANLTTRWIQNWMFCKTWFRNGKVEYRILMTWGHNFRCLPEIDYLISTLARLKYQDELYRCIYGSSNSWWELARKPTKNYYICRYICAAHPDIWWYHWIYSDHLWFLVGVSTVVFTHILGIFPFKHGFCSQHRLEISICLKKFVAGWNG